MEEVMALKASVADIAKRLGLPLVPTDWSGCDPVWPILEQMGNEGAVVVVKIDGQRTSEDDNGKYTVVLSGGTLKDDFFHTDTATLEEGIAKAILFYAERCWK